MNLNELLGLLKETREEITVKYDSLNEAKKREEAVKTQIFESMKTEKLQSARYEDYTTTIANRKTLKVVDEDDLVKYLKENKLTDYISERPNTLFEGFRKQAEREDKTIPGTEMFSKEYLAVRIKKETK